jgi:DNA-binding beta-propeller fold protein YncE
MNPRVKAGGLIVVAAAVLAIGSQGAAAPGGGQLWVTGQDGSRIHVVHRGGAAIDTIQLPWGTSPHFARLSPSGQYVYVPSLGYGTISVIRASDREIVDVIDPEPSAIATPPAVNSNPSLPGGLGTHDAKPSPDGSIVLAAQWSNNRIYKIAADEAHESWSMVQQSDPLPGAPICFVYNPSGEKAYVGLFPGTLPGLTPPNALILVVDVETLTVIKSLPVIGGWSCSWAQTHDGSTTWLTTNAPGGRVYRLDMNGDTLELLLETGASTSTEWA